MRFGRKKKKARKEGGEVEQGEDKKGKKKTKHRPAAVVSTPVHSQRLRSRESLRRRASVQRTSDEPRPKYVDVSQQSQPLEDVSYDMGQTESAETVQRKRSSAETMNQDSTYKPVLRGPTPQGSEENSQPPTPRKPVPPPSPPPPPPLWTIPRPVSRFSETAAYPPQPLEPHPLSRAKSLDDLLSPEPRLPRPRQSRDIQKWVRWRTDVNQKLSNFMMDPTDNTGQNILPDAFPKLKSMRNETLNAILFHAYTDESPHTTLDKLSYMIYGIPRIEGCNARNSRSMDELSLGEFDDDLTDQDHYSYTVDKIHSARDETVPEPSYGSYEEPVRHTGQHKLSPTKVQQSSPSPERRLMALTRGDSFTYQRPASRYSYTCRPNNDENLYEYDKSILPNFGAPRKLVEDPGPSYHREPPSHFRENPSHYHDQQPNSRCDSPLEFPGYGQFKPPVPGGVPTLLSGLALRGHLPTPPKAEVTSQGTHAHGGHFRHGSPEPRPGRNPVSRRSHYVNSPRHY